MTGVVSEIAFSAADEIVHDADAEAALEQTIDRMAADEAGAACDHSDGASRHVAPIRFIVRTL
jgi:hypothetical protein